MRTITLLLCAASLSGCTLTLTCETDDAGTVTCRGSKPSADGATPDLRPQDAMSDDASAPVDSKPVTDTGDAAAPVDGLTPVDTFPDASRDAGSAADSGSTRRMRIGTNFWNLGWGIWDDVFVPGATFAAGSNPWQSQFLAETSRYDGPLRFMDFGNTNWSEERSWDDRTPGNAPADRQVTLAYEWMADLCIRTGRDMWITVPHLADSTYQRSLATLLRDRLPNHLRLYVEWSNETWNGMFSQTDYAYAEGNRLRLDSDPWTAAFKYHVYAAVRLFAQFDAVWGNDPRLVKVIAGWSDEPYVATVHLQALRDPAINPGAVRVQAYAIAPYMGRDASTISQLRSSVPDATQEVRRHYDIVHPAGLSLITYEGGQHVLVNQVAVNRNPQIYDIYRQYLDGIAPYLDVFVHYLHNGAYGDSGAWGAEERVGQPLSQAHKLRALYDYIGQ